MVVNVLPSNTWFLEPMRFRLINSISISSAIVAGLTHASNRPTDTDHGQSRHA